MSDSGRLTAIATARRGVAKCQINQDFGIEEVKRGRRGYNASGPIRRPLSDPSKLFRPACCAPGSGHRIPHHDPR
jgi:hypothetical protein